MVRGAAACAAAGAELGAAAAGRVVGALLQRAPLVPDAQRPDGVAAAGAGFTSVVASVAVLLSLSGLRLVNISLDPSSWRKACPYF